MEIFCFICCCFFLSQGIHCSLKSLGHKFYLFQSLLLAILTLFLRISSFARGILGLFFMTFIDFPQIFWGFCSPVYLQIPAYSPLNIGSAIGFTTDHCRQGQKKRSWHKGMLIPVFLLGITNYKYLEKINQRQKESRNMPLYNQAKGNARKYTHTHEHI